jgi:hypothetical protein
MVKCPFCGFNNEDGALFCEQCKSDLGADAPAPAPSEPVPVAAVLEETIPMATAEPVPEAKPIEAEPEVPMAAVMQETPAVEPPAAPAEPVAEQPATPPPAAPAAAAAAVPAAVTPAAPPAKLPDGSQPRLVVLRGQKPNVEFPIYEGLNFIGRADEKPVDIDLEDQEPPDRVWCSRQHALITYEEGGLVVEDLNSANGTYLNRNRIYPGQKQPLKAGDVVQIGNVQLKVKV